MPAAPSRFALTLALLVLPLLGPSPALAQSTARGPQQLQQELFSTTARQSPARDAGGLRDEFRQLMRQYPPSLAEVLKLDPTLMTNAAYLRSYPGLEAFLAVHQQIPRNPLYFLNFARTSRDADAENSQRVPYSAEAGFRRDAFTFVGVTAVIAGGALILLWLIRTFLAHRRWLRASKLQMDLHSRLIDRLSSSTDVHAFLESAASNRLIADLPTMSDSGSRAGAPLGRILWSVQSGIVLTAAGIGLSIGRRYVPVGEVMVVPGIFAIAIGVGFVLAAGASYILSSRLGLIEPDVARADRPRARNTDELT